MKAVTPLLLNKLQVFYQRVDFNKLTGNHSVNRHIKMAVKVIYPANLKPIAKRTATT